MNFGLQKVTVSMVANEEANWMKFMGHTNEMIINKKGRKLFPSINYNIEGLHKDTSYAMVLEFHRVDDYRYNFSEREWKTSVVSRDSHIEANKTVKKIIHKNGFKTGEQWKTTGVNFDYVKITTDSSNTDSSMVFLHKSLKYVPIFSICVISPYFTNSPTNLVPLAACSIDFAEFIPVTRFHNETIKTLKMVLNPYSKLCLKRQLSSTPEADTENVEDDPEISNHSQPKRANLQDPPIEELSTNANILNEFKPDPVMLPDYSQFALLQNNMFAAAWGTYPYGIYPYFNPIANHFVPQFANFDTKEKSDLEI